MKTICSVIILLLSLALIWCLFFKMPVTCKDCVLPPTSGVTVINCESKSLAKQINSAKDGEIIKIVGTGDCNVAANELPLVISNNNIILDFNGLTFVGQTDKDLLVVSGQGNVFQNAVFTKARNGVVVLPGGNALFKNISAVENNGTGLCVFGNKSIMPIQNLRKRKTKLSKEKLRRPVKAQALKAVKADVSTQESVKRFCDSNSYKEQVKNTDNLKTSFSLFKNAVAAEHRPTSITICDGKWSNNLGNGGEIDAAYVEIGCGTKIVEFSRNKQNGLVINNSSTVEMNGSDMLHVNNNTFTGLEIDDSYFGLEHGTLNTINNKIGIDLIGGSPLDVFGSSIKSSGNSQWDLKMGTGTSVICDNTSIRKYVFLAPNKDPNSVFPNFDCPAQPE